MKRKNSNKLFIILLPAVIVIVMLAGFIYYSGLGVDKEPDAEDTKTNGFNMGQVSDADSDMSDDATDCSGVISGNYTVTSGEGTSEGTVDSDVESVTENSIADIQQDNLSGHADASQTSEGSTTDLGGYDTITISAVGDLTLGRDINFGYEGSYDQEFERRDRDYGYFLRNVKDIFAADDLTVGNLETTLTTATKMAVKRFRFKGDPSYTEILKQGNIEVVSIANNHTYDYLEKGYKDTLANLHSAGIGYFGNNDKYVTEIRGIKIGFLGYTYWDVSDSIKKKVKDAITELRLAGVDIVIVMYHWGIERD